MYPTAPVERPVHGRPGQAGFAHDVGNGDAAHDASLQSEAFRITLPQDAAAGKGSE
jgi:hypothetical protein